jgi:hypothetical protein
MLTYMPFAPLLPRKLSSEAYLIIILWLPRHWVTDDVACALLPNVISTPHVQLQAKAEPDQLALGSWSWSVLPHVDHLEPPSKWI